MLKLPVLNCPSCRRQFGLTVGTGITSLDSLPDPFQAICIHCETVSSFNKGDLETLTVRSGTAANE